MEKNTVKLELTASEADLVVQACDLYMRNNGLKNSANILSLVHKIHAAAKAGAGTALEKSPDGAAE